jgi:hypothetical protein
VSTTRMYARSSESGDSWPETTAGSSVGAYVRACVRACVRLLSHILGGSRYGAPPSSYDWSVTHARRRGGKALERLREGDWPSASAVTSVLGSWAAARARAESDGVRTAVAGRGHRARPARSGRRRPAGSRIAQSARTRRPLRTAAVARQRINGACLRSARPRRGRAPAVPHATVRRRILGRALLT